MVFTRWLPKSARAMALGALACAMFGGETELAAAPTQQDIDDLKRMLEMQERSMRELKSRIIELEGASRAAAPAPATAPAPAVTKPGEAPSPAEEAEARTVAAYGRQSPVTYRGSFDDKQDAVARPSDYTFDPQYRGFIPIPNTVFLIKFNPKPRVDTMIDSQNTGDDFRFVPALLPIEGTPAHGGGEQFNMNGNGSQLRLRYALENNPPHPRSHSSLPLWYPV